MAKRAKGTSGPGLLASQYRDCLFCTALCGFTSSTSAGLGATTEEGHINIRKHPKEGYRDSEVCTGQDVREAAEVPGCVQPRAERAEGRSDGGCSSLQGVDGQR